MASRKVIKLDQILDAIKREAADMLCSGATGSITLHFDGKCGIRHEINRKGELVEVEMPYQVNAGWSSGSSPGS